MRKYAFTFMALAAMFGLSSCNKELAPAENINENNKASVIYASTEDGSTKTALKGFSVVWSTGDTFTLDGETFTLTEGAGTTNGTFTGTLPTSDGSYDAWYGTDGTTLPAVQTYKAEAITNSPMHASVEVTGGKAGTISFKNLCGLLKLSLKGTATIRAITVYAEEAMAGAFTVGTDGGAVVTGSVKSISLDCGAGVTLNESTDTDFYIAIPANSTGYTNVRIKLANTEGKTHTKSLNSSYKLTITRSAITKASFAVGTFDAPPTINDHGYVNLAGYYWATENVYNATGYKYEGVSSYGSYYNQSESIKAAASWGGTWTLPSEAQWQALLDNCTWEWMNNYKFGGTTMNGYLVSDKTDASKFIFLPAAGYYWEGPSPEHMEYLLYWSSEELGNPTHKKDHARELFGTNSNKQIQWGDEKTGFPVRPVAATLVPISGTATAIIDNVETNVKWVQLWENGPKFAEFNVGATSPEGYGEYYAWGGITNKDANNVYKEGAESLQGTDDAATYFWGSNWRMPTYDELGEYDTDDKLCGGLLYECTDTWVENYNNTGINGRLYTGKGVYSSNSIFLPAAGYYQHEELQSWNQVFNENSGLNYWSSTPIEGDNKAAYQLCFMGDDYYWVCDNVRYIGCSVRAVLAE